MGKARIKFVRAIEDHFTGIGTEVVNNRSRGRAFRNVEWSDDLIASDPLVTYYENDPLGVMFNIEVVEEISE